MEFTYVHTETCTQMFIAVSFLTAPNWKQSRWPSTAKGSTNCATTPQNTAAAAAKLLQSCLTLCDPIDGSPPGSPVPGILQARTLEWVAISFSSAWNWKVKVKSLSCVQLFVTPWTVQARILEWVDIPVSRGSSLPRDRTQDSCIADGFFTSWAYREAQEYWVAYCFSSRSS